MSEIDAGLDEQVLTAAHDAVAALSPKARERLEAGAYFVRLPAFEAKRLIRAVRRQQAAIDGDPDQPCGTLRTHVKAWPCILPAGHDGSHRDEDGDDWYA